jgi:hypothetical protein
MRLRRTAGLAALALAPLLATGCSGGAPPASAGASHTTDPSVALARLVQCLHAHGQPSVYLSHRPASPKPDPTSQNGSNAQAIPTGIDMNSPQYQAAAKACGVSLPSGGG